MDIENKWEHVDQRINIKHHKTYAICFSASFSMTTSATADAPIISPSRSIVYSSGAKKLIKLPNLAVLAGSPKLNSSKPMVQILAVNCIIWWGIPHPDTFLLKTYAQKAFLIDVTWFSWTFESNSGSGALDDKPTAPGWTQDQWAKKKSLTSEQVAPAMCLMNPSSWSNCPAGSW